MSRVKVMSIAKRGSKRFPNFERYLEMTTRSVGTSARNIVIWLFASLGGVSMAMGAVSLLAAAFGAAAGVTVGEVMMTAALVFAGCALAAHRVLPRAPEATPLESEAREVSLLLKKHMSNRRLHKAAPSSVLTLLEESARQYLRLKSSLSSAFWQAPGLPDNYYSLRARADHAADRSMQEILVILRPRIAEDTTPRNWRDVVEDVAANIGFNIQEPEAVFPSELRPVLTLAEGLRNLANEVEQASIRAVSEGPVSMSADSALRNCLSDLRALNDAERELDSSIHERI